jgi:hypothetical protein
MPTEVNLDEIKKKMNNILEEKIAARKTYLAQTSDNLLNAPRVASAKTCKADTASTLDNLRAKAVLITKI